MRSLHDVARRDVTLHEVARRDVMLHEVALHEVTLHEVTHHEVTLHDACQCCAHDSQLAMPTCMPPARGCLVHESSQFGLARALPVAPLAIAT